MIEFQNATKTFATSHGDVHALSDFTLTIERGSFVAVCGHSGSGKSTLLSLAGGLALPSSGQVRLDDVAISELTPSDRASVRAEKIGFVFQMFHLLPYLDVLDNILVAASNGVDRRDDAQKLIEQFGLGDRRHHRPSQLSAGERQRVAMARALLSQPLVLLADEPTGNLDPSSAQAVLDLIGAFHEQGGTVLLVTHDERAADRAERILQLEKGRLISD